MTRPLRLLVIPLVMVFLVAAVLGAAGRVAGAQNRPTWTTGDAWTYTGTEGTTTLTNVQTVAERTTVTLGSTTYAVWHAVQTLTATSGGTSFTFTVNSWVQDSDLGVARTETQVIFLGNVTTTYEPPQSAAVFPLTVGATWTKTTLETITTSLGSSSSTVTYTGRVTEERQITVPAGTFTAAAVRSPESGNPYTLVWYSETVGNAVRTEEYDVNGNLGGSLSLSTYRYQGPTNALTLILLGVVGVIALIAIAAAVSLRRRHMRMPYPPPGQHPMPPQQPPVPPEQTPRPPEGPPQPPEPPFDL